MLRTKIMTALLALPFGLAACSGATGPVAQPEVVPTVSEAPKPVQAVPLIDAVLESDLAAVKSLVEAGANVNAVDEYGFRVLVNAMANYNVEIVDYLVKQGAETGLEKPKTNDDSKRLFGEGLGQNELLLAAAESGDLNSVKRLLASGANINAQDEGGFTVLVTAIAGSHTELVKYLVNQGATIVANNP
tara:strand:- start:16 stop:582 length:567 start_codon:yes stop_codon:yes gene_type:complete